MNIAPRIRILLLHVSKNRAHLLYFFYLGCIMIIYFSSHGSSLIGLPFPPSFVVYCFCSCDVRNDLVYTDVCSNLVFGDVCKICW